MKLKATLIVIAIVTITCYLIAFAWGIALVASWGDIDAAAHAFVRMFAFLLPAAFGTGVWDLIREWIKDREAAEEARKQREAETERIGSYW